MNIPRSFNCLESEVHEDFVCLILSFIFARYNLMANRVLLLLAMASRNDPNCSKILSETAGGFMFLLTHGFPHLLFNNLLVRQV